MSQCWLPDGTIDRKSLAAIVFSDPQALSDLNAITHPEIGRIMAERSKAADERGGVVVLDVPLMKATHRDQLGFDIVVVVDIPVELAVDRLVGHRGFDRSDAEARVANQISRRSAGLSRTSSSTTAAVRTGWPSRSTRSGTTSSRELTKDESPGNANEESG